MNDSQEKEKWPKFDIGSYGRPCFGERVSGDLAFAEEKDGWIFLAIVDGLGHGKTAHQIAQKAKAFLSEGWSRDVYETMMKLHEDLNGSGGAAVGLAAIDMEKRMLHYTGIGNTVLRKFGASPARLYSREGMVGAILRTPKEQQLALQDSDILLLHTDGVSENFEFDAFPQMQVQRASLVAKKVVQKFGNQFDDATCLVIKIQDES